MPKLSLATADQNRLDLETAALSCFVKQGYHGVSVRMIADRAGVSLGNLYTYFPDKLSIFRDVLERLSREFITSDNAFSRYLTANDFPHDLPLMGQAIAENVDRYRDYMKMMYVDVVEFDGEHIRGIFSNLDEKFRLVLGSHFDRLGGLGKHHDIDPGFAFIAIYMAFYQYFILTRLFGAKAPYGKKKDTQVLAQLTQLFGEGLGGTCAHARTRRRR